nr:Fanconi anemia group J protein homolog [Ipomoea batatas]
MGRLESEDFQFPSPACRLQRTLVVHIGGIPVEFPYQPYGTQLAFMNRVIATLDRAQREGRSHALLESPTGTGKSLSLLCSALAWQQNFKSKSRHSNPTRSKPDPEALADPIGHGGGFIPETQPSGNPEPAPSATTAGKNQKKKKLAPTIFYATRTHSQISQVIREYRKTSYRVPMGVLASRRHYCTNMNLRGMDNIDEKCKLLLKDKEAGCCEFKNAHKVKAHPSLQKGGCHEAHDIEDLVKVGQVVRGYAPLSMADDADLVFCPYSYIINPVVRKAMDVDINGAIIILDEAHNIEDISRDAGSMDVEEDVLLLSDAMTYKPLIGMVQVVCQVIFSWTGDKALKELQEANVSRQYFPILKECATKAIRVASDAEPDVAHLSGMAATVLEGLFSSLNYFFSENGIRVCDYQLALRRHRKRVAGSAGNDWTHTFSLWCLNPAVVFREIADRSLSVILTSGTLSPMNSFSSELGVPFSTSLEAPHVIDTESQLWAAVISRGPSNYPLNASYKTADSYAFQDSLGTSLEEICKVVPGGCLVFFPSYKLMEKLSSRWQATGQWDILNAKKPLFVEPRGSQEEFESVLKGYYESIHQGRKPVLGRRKGRKSEKNLSGSSEDNKKGAAFLAVCRGKVSEGIDFSDEMARVAILSLGFTIEISIVVGIPFPNINDIQVSLKKKFNDTYKLSKSLLSGSEWYCQQAFRAVNQATGRCIRHKFDYGAIIFLDERFCQVRNRAYISKWLRNSIKQYDCFDDSLDGLKSFFRDIKDRIGKPDDALQNSVINLEDMPSANKSRISRKTNQKVNISTLQGEKAEANDANRIQKSAGLFKFSKMFTRCDLPNNQVSADIQGFISPNEKNSKDSRSYIDLECESPNGSRCSGEAFGAACTGDPQSTFVMETPGVSGTLHSTSPESFSKEYSNSTIIQESVQDLNNLTCDNMTISDVKQDPESKCLEVTPERKFCAVGNGIIPDVESSVNFSANSRAEKRRKHLDVSLVSHLQGEKLDSAVASTLIGDCSPPSIECDSMFSLSDENGPKSPRSQALNHCDKSYSKSSLAMDKRLQIFCSSCSSALGIPENNLIVKCSMTSSTKVHLKSLWKRKSDPDMRTSSIPILVSDMESINRRIYNITRETIPAQGIWCKDDGCVFKTVFCPFCANPNNCLGLQVMAADASNVQFLNKILFYSDSLLIKAAETSTMDLSPCLGSTTCGKAGPSSIENFSYTPYQSPTYVKADPSTIENFSYTPDKNSTGWRSTKSKMRLPKRGHL